MDGLLLTAKEAALKRAATAERNRCDAARFRVGGEFVTRREIAQRVHHGTSWVSKRLRELRMRRQALTWDDFA